MDIDATEIQIRVKQPDGSYTLQWVPLSELVKLIERTASSYVTDVFAAIRAGHSPSESPSATPQTLPE
jgi:hypothetical protein